MGNHLSQFHKVSDIGRRKRLMEDARSFAKELPPQGQPTIFQVSASPKSKWLVCPTLPSIEGSTKNYVQYALSTPELRELVAFHHNMTSFDGGSKTEDNAKSIATDIAKFIAFCDKSKFKWEYLFDPNQLKQLSTSSRSRNLGLMAYRQN